MSKFCTVKVLVEPKNQSTLWNMVVSAFQGCCTYVNAFGTKLSVCNIVVGGCFSEVSVEQGSVEQGSVEQGSTVV